MILPRFDLLTRMGKSVSKKQAVAAALAANDEESARGRLLSAAPHLFCKNGINATGIDAIETGCGDAQVKLARIFTALKIWFGEERFYGCHFINAVAEHDKDAKQFRAIALRHKKVVLSHIEKLAGEMGAVDPQVLAHQLALLIDGAIVAAMVSRDPGVADTAGLAAGSLFGPSRVKKPKRAAGPA